MINISGVRNRGIIGSECLVRAPMHCAETAPFANSTDPFFWCRRLSNRCLGLLLSLIRPPFTLVLYFLDMLSLIYYF